MPDDFYHSVAWKNKRKAILIRDRYQCQLCKRYGKHVDATTVHHIKHYNEYPELGLVSSNLISVCSACHNTLHPEKAGWRKNNNNKRGMKILVIGNQGSGKTTYVRNHLGNGLCYDLDAIASAFRLREPHEEYHEASRKIANELLYGFSNNATELADVVYIIRTAPSQEEVNRINPDRVVYMKRSYPIQDRKDYQGVTDYTHKIEEILQYFKLRGIPVKVVES